MDGLRRAVDVGALCFGYGKSAVIDAMGSQWPAVVLAGLRNIDLIAAAWTMLVRPELARPWIKRRSLLIAMAVRPDFRAYLRIADERVVVGNAAVGVRAYYLALQLVQVLRGGADRKSTRLNSSH